MSTALPTQYSAGPWEQRVGAGDRGAITAEVNELGGLVFHDAA
jgi:hypothetical protein